MNRCVLWLAAVVGAVAISVSMLPYEENSGGGKAAQGAPASDVGRCKENLVMIAAKAEEFYDEIGRYPDGLDDLAESYVIDGSVVHHPQVIPVCPATGRATYVLEYDRPGPDQHEYDTPYTLKCSGRNHAGLPEGFPRLRQPAEWPDASGRRHVVLYPP